MDLSEIRVQIDSIDNQLVDLFCHRMQLAAQVADYKKANNMPIFVPAREQEILQRVAQQAGPEMGNYTRLLYAALFELSRGYQSKRNHEPSPLVNQIQTAIAYTSKPFPRTATVACLDMEDAYSQIACWKIFKDPIIHCFANYEDVFQAIETDVCQYGILPIENATAGSLNKVYSLLARHNFSIVRSCRLNADHDLPVTTDAAALTCAKSSVQDQDNNNIRFICISKNLEIYPGADRTSIMMILPHRSGALYNVLARMHTLGIHVAKLESRPLPDRESEFLFYFDLEVSVHSEEFIQLVSELDDLSEEYKYLGSYSEVV